MQWTSLHSTLHCKLDSAAPCAAHCATVLQGRICARFQQPAPMLPGQLGNLGWREEEARAAEAAAAGAKPAVADKKAAEDASQLDKSKKYVTMDMLDQHQEEDSVWFAYKGQVFDGTKFLDDHPGGADSILMAGGTDATEDFEAVHSDSAKEQLKQYYIAELAAEGVKARPCRLAGWLAGWLACLLACLRACSLWTCCRNGVCWTAVLLASSLRCRAVQCSLLLGALADLTRASRNHRVAQPGMHHCCSVCKPVARRPASQIVAAGAAGAAAGGQARPPRPGEPRPRRGGRR